MKKIIALVITLSLVITLFASVTAFAAAQPLDWSPANAQPDRAYGNTLPRTLTSSTIGFYIAKTYPAESKFIKQDFTIDVTAKAELTYTLSGNWSVYDNTLLDVGTHTITMVYDVEDDALYQFVDGLLKTVFYGWKVQGKDFMTNGSGLHKFGVKSGAASIPNGGLIETAYGADFKFSDFGLYGASATYENGKYTISNVIARVRDVSKNRLTSNVNYIGAAAKSGVAFNGVFMAGYNADGSLAFTTRQSYLYAATDDGNVGLGGSSTSATVNEVDNIKMFVFDADAKNSDFFLPTIRQLDVRIEN